MRTTVKNHKKSQPTPVPPAKRWIALAVVITGAVVLRFSVDWYPAILPDSLAYLRHSNDLTGIGLVHEGYRQVGYPAFLASIDWLSAVLPVEPLSLVVLVQHLLLMVSVGLSVVVLRYWSIPIVLVLTLPALVSYGNFLLTEALAIPLVVMMALCSVVLLQNRSGYLRLTALAFGTLLAVALPLIRFHLGLLSLVWIAAVAIAWYQGIDRRWAIASCVFVLVAIVATTGAMTAENLRDAGTASPTLNTERSRFWMLWETRVIPNADRFSSEAPDIFGDGTYSSFVLRTDDFSVPHDERAAIYEAANQRILTISGTSLMGERAKSLIGALLLAGRVDDMLAAHVAYAFTTEIPLTNLIHQYPSVSRPLPTWIGNEYNAGTQPAAVLRRPSTVPTMPAIEPRPVISGALILSLVVGIYLLTVRRARWLAALGLLPLLGYAVVSGWFLADNLRYLLPAYLFTLVLVSAAASSAWGNPSSFDVETPSQELGVSAL